MLYSGHIKRTYDFLAKTNEVNSMEKAPKYFIVDSSALPEIFRKVAEAKRMLETGETLLLMAMNRTPFFGKRISV